MKIQCKYSGMTVEGDFVRAEEDAHLPECLECGAGEDTPCTAPNLRGDYTDIDPWVHSGREAHFSENAPHSPHIR